MFRELVEEELRLDVAEPDGGPVPVEVRQLEGTRDDGGEGVVGGHRLVLDVHVEKSLAKSLAKSNVILGRGAPHWLGGKVGPRPQNFENLVGAEKAI